MVCGIHSSRHAIYQAGEVYGQLFNLLHACPVTRVHHGRSWSRCEMRIAMSPWFSTKHACLLTAQDLLEERIELMGTSSPLAAVASLGW
jgi:hypothetical protein